MDEATAKLRRNESRKLGATFLNSVGVAFFVAAILQPFLLFVQQGSFGVASVAFSIILLGLSAASALSAQSLIKRLEA